MARHIGLALLCGLCWTLGGCSKRSVPPREPPNEELATALLQVSLANLLSRPQADESVGLSDAPKPPAAQASDVVPTVAANITGGTDQATPAPPLVTEVTNVASSEQPSVVAAAPTAPPIVTAVTNVASSEQPSVVAAAPTAPPIVTAVTNVTTITNDAAQAEPPADDPGAAPQAPDETSQVDGDDDQAPSVVAKTSPSDPSPVALEVPAAQERAIEAQIQSTYGAGPGFTGIGAGSGYTGVGAGSGHTGIGADSRAVVNRSNDSGNYGGWGVVVWFTAWGPIYEPVAVR